MRPRRGAWQLGTAHLPQRLVQAGRAAALGAQARPLLRREARLGRVIWRRRALPARRRRRRGVCGARRQRRQRHFTCEHVVAALRDTGRSEPRGPSLKDRAGMKGSLLRGTRAACLKARAAPCCWARAAANRKAWAGRQLFAWMGDAAHARTPLQPKQAVSPNPRTPQGRGRACCVSPSVAPPLPGRDPPATGGKLGPASGACAGGGMPRRASSMRYRHATNCGCDRRPSSPATAAHTSLSTPLPRPDCRKKAKHSLPCAARAPAVSRRALHQNGRRDALAWACCRGGGTCPRPEGGEAEGARRLTRRPRVRGERLSRGLRKPAGSGKDACIVRGCRRHGRREVGAQAWRAVQVLVVSARPGVRGVQGQQRRPPRTPGCIRRGRRPSA